MLFGHQNNDVTQPAPDPVVATPTAPSLNPLAVDPTTGVSLPVAPEEEPVSETNVSTSAAPASLLTPPDVPTPPAPPLPEPPSAPTVDDGMSVPQPTPLPEPAAAPEGPQMVTDEPEATSQQMPELTPAAEEPVMPLDQPEPATNESSVPAEPIASATPMNPMTVAVPTEDDLFAMKQQAIAQLTPLVDQLDQTPEERFRTKMMMIQSTDDQTLIKDAYDAALAITDEKVRAQALLDIVNEINYFTSQHATQAD